MTGTASANEFSTEVISVNTALVADSYELNADIIYKLSPVAKEALQKGISLVWTTVVNVEKQGWLWNSNLKTIEISYQIQNHVLLNLYSVKRLNSDEKTLFSTLAAAVDFISKIRGLTIVNKQAIQTGQPYQIALKVKFEHEALPVPMRPFSYFDSQWALSSPWTLWPLQN